MNRPLLELMLDPAGAFDTLNVSVWVGISASEAEFVIVNVCPAMIVWFGMGASTGAWLTVTASKVATQLEALLWALTAKPTKGLFPIATTVVVPT